jgi:FMN phosphatase YigB (HAD superfamily)
MPDSLPTTDIRHKAQITSGDIPHILDAYGDSIKVLSLDCFDTLLWRKTATPRDVFALLADHPAAGSLGITTYQRVSAAQRAYRAKFLETGSRQIHIDDIYRSFSSLSGEAQAQLVEAEIQTEMDVLFAFPPYVDLIRQAHARGIRVIIVSDIYLREADLRRLLAENLPADAMQAISKIYCSFDYGTGKSDALFPIVIEDCGVEPSQILHIGDHEISDAEAPRKLGVNALHFLQFEPEVANFLRLQHAASSLAVLGQIAPAPVTQPRYSPFRPVFSAAQLQPYAPQTMIGYMSFGPVMYAYARFLMDEVEALEKQGKRVKVFFLLRDAYLLSQACEAYAGKPVGKLVRIRKFIAVAASFRTRADVDHYISGIKPEHYDARVIAEQLLLPPELIQVLILMANQSDDPQGAFQRELHDDGVLELIFRNSAAYRERLKRYMLKEMQIEEGDTVVLADTGYAGVTQDHLTRVFQDELNIEILGRYVLGSHEADRPAASKSLITTSWCDHSLFEQSCTFKEGAAIDYDMDGEPVFEEARLSDAQYAKVADIQAECLRFIRDAKAFFAKAGVTHDDAVFQRAAHAALFRHVYLPLEAELDYFKDFQHDKDMGPDRKKTIYDLTNTLKAVRGQPSPYRLDAYETRGLGLDFTFSALMQRALQLDLAPEDMNTRVSPLTIGVETTQGAQVFSLEARYRHDGYFSVTLPYARGVSMKMLLGEHYEWLQIDQVGLLDSAGSVLGDVSGLLEMQDIDREGEIYRCRSRAAAATIPPVNPPQDSLPQAYHVVFRPLVLRAQAA